MKQFTLTDTQVAAFNQWAKERPVSRAADGGQFEFRFFITGIGVVVKVVDLVSNETLDLTDYSSW